MINSPRFISSNPIRALKIGYAERLNGSLRDVLVLFVCLH